MKFTKVLILILFMFLAACASSQPAAPTQLPERNVQPAVSTPEPTATIEPTIPVEPSPTLSPPIINIETVETLTRVFDFGEGEYIRSMAFSPNKNIFATAGGNTEDFAVRIWNVENGTLFYTLEDHTDIVWSVSFSPDGKLLVSTSADGTAKIWDVASGRLIRSLDFLAQANHARFSPDGQTLAIGGIIDFPDAAIWTYSVSDWQPVLILNISWNVPDIEYTPDGSLLIGGGTSREVKIWRSSDGSELKTLIHEGQVTSLAVSPDGSTLAAGLCAESGDGGTCARTAVWFWDIQTGEIIAQVYMDSDWLGNIEYSNDGSIILAGSRDSKLFYIDTEKFEAVQVLSYPPGSGYIALSKDGRALATVEGFGSRISIWGVLWSTTP